MDGDDGEILEHLETVGEKPAQIILFPVVVVVVVDDVFPLVFEIVVSLVRCGEKTKNRFPAVVLGTSSSFSSSSSSRSSFSSRSSSSSFSTSFDRVS